MPSPSFAVTRRLLVSAGLCAFAGCIGLDRGSSAGRPNVIVIMTDDQGLGDLGCMGNPVLETPNIDRLAGQSARVAHFYVSPVCTPTRASLMTGRYAYRTRAVDTWVGRAMMEPDEVTIAEILRDAGYTTGIFGKWHLGDCYPMRAIDQGFDRALVHRGGGLAQPSEPRENSRRYTNPILFENGTAVRTEGYCTDVYFDAAIEFVRASQEDPGQRPFFVYLPTNAPHTPLHDVPEELYAKYRDRDLSAVLPEGSKQADQVARVYAMIENIDQNVGRLLAALDEYGVADNTVVVYLHDNGHKQPRYCSELRGTKGTVYDGGIRSPLFVRWPGRLEPGEEPKRFGAHIDLTPTLLDLVDVDVPDGVNLDGRSLVPLLSRDGRSRSDAPWPHRTIVLQVHRGDEPVRGHHVAVRGPRYKAVHPTGFGREQPPPDVAWELYDMHEDPGESNDLAGEHPNLVASMRSYYDAWFDDVSSTRPGNYDPPRIIVGTEHETETMLTRQDWRRLSTVGGRARGHWLLNFDGSECYDIQVIMTRPVADVRAELTIGDLRRVGEFAGPTDTYVFEEVVVPAGDAELEVTFEMGGDPERREGAYQVFLRRR